MIERQLKDVFILLKGRGLLRPLWCQNLLIGEFSFLFFVKVLYIMKEVFLYLVLRG